MKAIEDAISLCKTQLRKYIFPYYDINYSSKDNEEVKEVKEEDMEVEESSKYHNAIFLIQ